jgi:membrane protease YdiL (CAAX protease family)
MKLDRNRIRWVFMGPQGLRAAWRLAIFFAAAMLATLVVDQVKIAIIVHLMPHNLAQGLDPMRVALREFADFSTLILAGLLMARIEKRRLGDYGLSLRRAFRLTFWEGTFYGFAGVSLVLGVMHLTGHYQFGTAVIHGSELLRWGVLYMLAFLGIALMEEYSFRGYILYTAITGIGFWPAALIISVVFGVSHMGNAGETPLGIVDVALFSLVFCFVIRRTGDLWMAVGFHLAWNWGEAFFYGLPDSGIPAQARYLVLSIQGSNLWTGGSAGPEASFLDPLVLLLIALAVHLRYPTVTYRPGQPHAAAEPIQA